MTQSTFAVGCVGRFALTALSRRCGGRRCDRLRVSVAAHSGFRTAWRVTTTTLN